MNKLLVVSFAVVVALASAAHLPEDLKPALAKLEPAIQKIADYVREHKVRFENEDDRADIVPEGEQVEESDEEFRKKPTNLKKLSQLKKIAEVPEFEEEEDLEDGSDAIISLGLAQPIKVADIVDVEEEESDDDDEDDDAEIKPLDEKNEEADDDADVMISFGLDEPLDAAALENDEQAEKEEDEEEEDREVKLVAGLVDTLIKKLADIQDIELN